MHGSFRTTYAPFPGRGRKRETTCRVSITPNCTPSANTYAVMTRTAVLNDAQLARIADHLRRNAEDLADSSNPLRSMIAGLPERCWAGPSPLRRYASWSNSTTNEPTQSQEQQEPRLIPTGKPAERMTTMATVVFTEPGGFMKTRFPKSRPLRMTSSPIQAAKNALTTGLKTSWATAPHCGACSDRWRSLLPPTPRSCCTARREPARNWLHRAIHKLSRRRHRSFVCMNCAATPSGLLESDVFGHEKGAFTGALIQKKGRFELADGGTFFLDEIGDISLELQPKLLRAVQEQEFERLGSTRTIQVDVRMIAATHRSLRDMVRDGSFREDLFYRLNVFPIEIPPLRERREDIPLLVNYFVSKFSRRMGKQINSIPDRRDGTPHEESMAGKHPGTGELYRTRSHPYAWRRVRSSDCGTRESARDVFRQPLHLSSGRIQRHHRGFERSVRTSIGRGGAAERLGLKRTTLQTKMRKLNICRADYDC